MVFRGVIIVEFFLGIHTFGILNIHFLRKILLLSDTHSHFDDKIAFYAAQADEIWHAGDVGTTKVLDALSSLKPLRAVYGNIDGHQVRLRTEEFLSFTCEGVRVLITHIAGYPGRYNPTAKKMIEKHQPKLFICGHSHILKVMHDKNLGHLHMNPGAVGISGFHKFRTLLRFEIEEGEIKNLEAIELGQRGTLAYTVHRTD
jgi:putative phosphoesterase